MAGIFFLATGGDSGVTTGALLVSLVLIVLAMLVAAAETAVAAVRRGRVQQLVDEGSDAARTLQRLLENSSGYVATSQLLITAAVVGVSTLLVAAWGAPLTSVMGSATGGHLFLALIVLLMSLVLVQQVGRSLGLRQAEAIALTTAGPARVAVLLLSPVVKLLNACGALIYRQPVAGTRDAAIGVTEAGIILQVDVAEEEGVLEEGEGQMIRSIFEFGATVAREIMVPRIDVIGADSMMTLGEVVDQAIQAGHSRIPIYNETIDTILGIFYVKDALRFLREGRLDVKVNEVMRLAYFVPETKKVDKLLQEMQSRRVHVAVVVDEYGGTAGMVTIEDILEEIVGEIQDEFDEEEARLQRVSEHEVVIDAMMTLDDVNDTLMIKLQAEDVDTLGGYVYVKLGRVPGNGDEIIVDGVRLIVDDVEGNRVNKVRIIKNDLPAGGDAEGAVRISTAPPPRGDDK